MTRSAMKEEHCFVYFKDVKSDADVRRALKEDLKIKEYYSFPGRE